MSRSYSPDQIAAMARLLSRVAEQLGIDPLLGRPEDTVAEVLASTAGWSQSLTRAAGPFGAFLAGTALTAQPGPDSQAHGRLGEALGRVELLVDHERP